MDMVITANECNALSHLLQHIDCETVATSGPHQDVWLRLVFRGYRARWRFVFYDQLAI